MMKFNKESLIINPYLEVAVRALATYVFLLVMTRLMGREQISQLTFFDYVVGITIGSIAGTLTTTFQDPLLPGLLGMFIWALMPILTGFTTLKWVPARKIIEGEPITVIQNGKLDEEAMARQRLNYDDLMMLLRENKVFNINDVENAIYERNGELAVQLKSQFRTVIPADLNISTQFEGMPTTLVQDGVVLQNRLKEVSLSKDWLFKKLQAEYGISSFDHVSMAQLDTQGNLYADLIDWNPPNKPG